MPRQPRTAFRDKSQPDFERKTKGCSSLAPASPSRRCESSARNDEGDRRVRAKTHNLLPISGQVDGSSSPLPSIQSLAPSLNSALSEHVAGSDGTDLSMDLRTLIAETIEQALTQRPQSIDERNWLSPREAADYLGCTTQHLQMLRARRTGPTFVKFGRLVRYAREDLDNYMLERKVETKS